MRIFSYLSLAAALMFGTGASAQDYAPAFKPGAMTDEPVGAPNEVMVLGTPHLSQLPKTFRIDMVDPLVERLVAWHPTAVATEDTSGVRCDAMRRMAARNRDNIESYCFDTAEAAKATGLDVPAANTEAENALADWPTAPTATQRRHLAAVLLAAGEPSSALVQWLRLPKAERRAEGILQPELVAYLDQRLIRPNESNLIAAVVAARCGLERVWPVDDQTIYMGEVRDEAAYGAAISKAWDNPATKKRFARDKALEAGLAQRNGLLAYYREMNAPEQAALAYESDWGAALADPSPEGYGRRYVAYWETRNLRMVANIREVLGRRPGTRMLAIVGASHKPYYEAYLSQMRDVRLVDVLPVLR